MTSISGQRISFRLVLVSLAISAIQFFCAIEKYSVVRIVAERCRLLYVQLTDRSCAGHYVIRMFELFLLVFFVCASLHQLARGSTQ